MKKKLRTNFTISSLIIIGTFLFIFAPYSLSTIKNTITTHFSQNNKTTENALTYTRTVHRPYQRNPRPVIPVIKPIPLPIINPLPAYNPVTGAEPQSPTTTTEQINQMKTMAWIYPGAPACNAGTEYADGRKIDVLKAEFFKITDGALNLLIDECNSFSVENIVQLKKSSTEQFATISSSDPDSMNTFMARAIKTPNTDITTLVDFVTNNNITGIELDFEGFSNWSPTAYKNYLSFVTVLGNALHEQGKKLMIDGPAVSNSTEESSWYLWRYADFVDLPVDTVVVMAYDYQFDYAAGTPISPLIWLGKVTNYISTQYPKAKLSIGLPSYGYQGTVGEYDIKILTREQISKLAGYSSAKRDPASGEMTWQSGNTVYFFQDAISLGLKRDVVEKLGINSVSIWHLGGNSWF